MPAVPTGLLPAPQWGVLGTQAPILVVELEEGQRDALAKELRLRTGLEVETRASVPPDRGEWGLVLLDAQAVSAAQTDDVYERFLAQHVVGKLLILVPSSERQDVTRWFERGARHVICRDEPHAAMDAVSAARKLLWGGATGPECYLRPGARTWSLTISHSRDKALVFELCADVEHELGLGKRKGEALKTIAEEFTTNALYNAPVDHAGSARFAHLNRRDEVDLAEGEVIRVLVTTDDDRVAISVTDPFGSLRPTTVPNYLSKCFQAGEDQVDQKQGGAGLGLYFVYQAVSHLAININPGHSTEMIGFLDCNSTAGAIQRRAHSFGLFVVD